jgi:Holliday junction resolvasome RuvABC endonuclease subunit
VDRPFVIGLDTDSNGFHGVLTEALAEEMSDLGYVTFKSKAKSAEIRRIEMFGEFRRFMDRVPDGTHIFCEEPLALQNGKTTRLLGLAAGTLYGAFLAVNPDIWWHWVDVAHWKKEVVGRGNANKADIEEFVRANPAWRSRFGMTPAFDKRKDLFDAWCLKVYGVRQLIGGDE